MEDKYATDENYCKVRDHCCYTGEYRGPGHSSGNSKYSVPKEIPIFFHNGSNYHFIIKDLAKEFEKQFNCLGKYTEKYITFSVPIEKEAIRIDKSRKEIIKTISEILQFIDSARFIARSLLNLVNNLAEGIHRIKCKHGRDNKKSGTCGIKYKNCACFLEYTNFYVAIRIIKKSLVKT